MELILAAGFLFWLCYVWHTSTPDDSQPDEVWFLVDGDD